MHAGIRVVTFNVCGIKNLSSFKPWNKESSLGSTFESFEFDIICFQETKLQSQDLRKEWAIVSGYQSFFTFSSARKGYSGVAIYTRNNIPVLAAEEGLTGWLPDLGGQKTYRDAQLIGGYPEIAWKLGKQIDQEGRALVLDVGVAVIIGLYCPANSTGTKTEYRTIFFELLDQRVRNLRNLGREVIVFGDINVSPALCDSARAQQEVKKSLRDPTEFSNEPQRKIVNSWLSDGFHDTTRELHPDREKMYTCWDLRVDGRGANFGSRIDLILVSDAIKCIESDIMLDIYGSDHCPVYSDLELSIPAPPPNYTVPLLSRKRNAIFAGIQAFWTAGARTKKCSSPVNVGVQPAPRQQDSGPVAGDGFKIDSPGGIKKSDSKTKSKHVPVSAFFTSKTDLKVEDDLQLKSQPVARPIEMNPEKQTASWKDIFTIKPPVCYHQEKTKLVKCNKGPNKGRSFWSCCRPQGEENNMEFRCKFFKWA